VIGYGVYMVRFMVFRSIVGLSALLLAIPAWAWKPAPEKCVFDHVLLTLPEAEYRALKKAFIPEAASSVVAAKIGAQWKIEPSDQKGYIMFEDKSYIEVWNKGKFDEFGYQEGCKVQEQDTIKAIAKDSGVEPSNFPGIMTVGTKGLGGNVVGGMFYLWQPKHVVATQGEGIREIMKLVNAEKDGSVIAELVSEYKRAGLKLHFENKKAAMIATDGVGKKRIAIAEKSIEGNGLVAILFSKTTGQDEVLTIEGIDKSKMFIELKGNSGALVFRGPDFQKYRGLSFKLKSP
jgi:hypothetical protein